MPSIGPGLGIELPELAARAMVARSEKELGPLTILVNNAGVSWQGTLDSYDAEQVARMRRINVEGLIHATRAVIGCMRKRRYGRVVNVSSIAARFAAKAMMGRIGEPEDVANAIAFLASPESSWITAQILTVDGGRMDYIGHA